LLADSASVFAATDFVLAPWLGWRRLDRDRANAPWSPPASRTRCARGIGSSSWAVFRLQFARSATSSSSSSRRSSWHRCRCGAVTKRTLGGALWSALFGRVGADTTGPSGACRSAASPWTGEWPFPRLSRALAVRSLLPPPAYLGGIALASLATLGWGGIAARFDLEMRHGAERGSRLSSRGSGSACLSSRASLHTSRPAGAARSDSSPWRLSKGGGPRGATGLDVAATTVFAAQFAQRKPFLRRSILVVWPEDTVRLATPLQGSFVAKDLGAEALRLHTTLLAGVTVKRWGSQFLTRSSPGAFWRHHRTL